MLTPAYAQENKVLSECYKKANSQYDLNSCANQDFMAADAELDRVYEMIRQEYKDDPLFLDKLKVAQQS